ncbi:GYF domain-containing protein, partial [Rhodobacter capsulatus]
FSRASLVWAPGQEGWKPASDVPDLAALFATTPPPPPPGV